MRKRFSLLFVVIIAATGAVWAGFHFGALKWHNPFAYSHDPHSSTNIASWAEAVEKVKEDRGPGAYVAVEIPPELRHYEDRHWFLAAQVAEVEKHNVQTSQDFVDLAAMIARGEMITLPAVTETYILYGVGEKADDEPFTRFKNNAGETTDGPAVVRTIELYSETELNNAYMRLNEKRSNLQKEVDDLKTQSRALTKRDREKQKELQKQISTSEQDLNSTNEAKARLDEVYGQPESRQKLLSDYESLQSLAKNFAGRFFNIDEPSHRQQMKVVMLSSLRPEALKILDEVASAYHREFARPLPVSSLVRPEEYQHDLRKVNRNAVLIETPPHSTGLAFDIDYRYMSAAEQTFVMAELARLKRDGRIEVIRERNANYHVFAFIDGTRPSDELIAASLEKAGAPVAEANQADEGRRAEVGSQSAAARGRKPGGPTKVKSKSQKVRTAKSKARKRR
jgi:hypothetical protein